MAQSLDNRINAALRSAARLKDVEAVIADVEAEVSATGVKLEAETARSIDPALTTPQAREARNNAADLEHDIRRLHASLGMLREKREQIVNDTEEGRRRAQYDAALVARNELARRIRARYPKLAKEILELVQQIRENNALLAVANRERPTGVKDILGAEGTARGTHAYSWQSTPIATLESCVLPTLSTLGNYLPLPDPMAMGFETRKGMANAAVEADQAFADTSIEGIDDPTGPEKQDA